MKDYYKILELDPTATAEQIASQHKLLLHAWHLLALHEGDVLSRLLNSFFKFSCEVER